MTMQPIQDKDLDKLFKDRFENLEVQPSAGSWKKITDTMDKPLKKRKAYPFWMAAASVVLLATAALLIYKPVEVIRLQGKANTQISSNVGDQLKNEPQDLNENNIGVKVSGLIDKEPSSLKANRLSQKLKTRYVREIPSVVKPEKRTSKDLITNDILIAKNNEKVPVKRTEDKVLTKIYEPVYSAQIEERDLEMVSAEEISRPRIKSVGGLVNFVISRVDKREDKIIEFKDGEEGSEISGINIGLLKFKNRKR